MSVPVHEHILDESDVLEVKEPHMNLRNPDLINQWKRRWLQWISFTQLLCSTVSYRMFFC